MYIKNILLVLLLTTTFYTNAQIIESPIISVVHEHVDSQDTLVLFDLDETVFEVPGKINDFWFTQMWNHARTLGHDDHGAANAIVPLYESLMGQAPTVLPAEENTIALIHALQKKQIPVMGLTTRGATLAESTAQQLDSIGIDFSVTSITPYNISFVLPKEQARLYKGVMFCASNSKGDALKALLNAAPFKPKKIVFVDDKERHLKAVKQAATDLGCAFIGVRYSCLDEKMKEYVLDEESKALLAPPAHKMIVEHHSTESVKQYVVPGCMAIFDVDDTLLHIDHPTEFGSNKWINHMMFYGKKEHQLKSEELDSWVIPMYVDAQLKTPFKPVEEATAGIIQELQKDGVPVIGLTARRLELIDITLDNLRKMGIDFSAAPITEDAVSFPIDHPNIFVNGVMFCGGSRDTDKIGNQTHAKDRAIKALIKHFDLKPTRIIVVDDRPDYLESIVNMIVSMGIDCVGIRYSRSDERLKRFSLDEESKELLRSFAATKIAKNS